MIARGVAHLVVVALVLGSVTLGVLGAQGTLRFDTELRAVAPARGAVAEVIAGAQDEAVTLELQPPATIDPTNIEATNIETRVLPTPPPDLVAAIPLPAPPPVRSGYAGPSTTTWEGPTGYVDGDGSLLWPVPGGYVSQYFWGSHQALDIAHSYGGAVLAAAAGTVVWSGWMNNGGGLVLTIQHSDGRVTGYNHLGSVLVSAGDAVAVGQQVATVGCTGICTGPHVHFEVVVGGVRVNPLRFL